jgi:hypothetical protein
MKICTLSRTLVCCLLLAGCGSSPGDRTERFQQTPLKKPAQSGTESRRACSLLSSADVARQLRQPGQRFSASPNDSTDLSVCDWRAGGLRVELVLDTAPRAQLRFYNQLSEQLEYYNQDPRRRPYQLEHVGDDSAYGGAGAWWTRRRNQLVAYDHDKIVKIRVNVDGWSDARARAASVRLGKRAVRELRR